MKLLLKLAWRNIWRNKRRSILTIVAITFATFLTIVARGIGIGTWEFNLRNTVDLFSGYLQVQRAGYQENPSLSKSFIYPGKIEAIVNSEPLVTGYAPRILADGLISFKDNSTGTAILGIDAKAEKHFRFQERIREGRMFQDGDIHEVVLGYRLLTNLKASIGDTMVILAQGYDGVMGNLKFRVSGTMKLGVPEFDQMAVLMDLRAGQELLAMEGRISIVALSVAELRDIGEVQEDIGNSLNDNGLDQLVILAWDEVLPELKQAMEFDRIGDWIFLWILIIIVTFGILNTVLMSVTERFREFGVTLAIGLQPRKLVALVFLETTFLALVGIAVGSVIGQGLNVYFSLNPIVLSGEFAAFYEEYGFLPQIVATGRITVMLTVAGSLSTVPSFTL